MRAMKTSILWRLLCLPEMKLVENIFCKMAVAIPGLMLGTMVGGVLLRYPCNHGAGYGGYLYPSLAAFVFSIVVYVVFKKAAIGVLLALACVLMILAADALNLYIPYETWIGRGMPDFGEFR